MTDQTNTTIGDPFLIKLAGIYDTSNYEWAPDIFEVTVQLINQGWWDVLPTSQHRLEYSLENSNCDATTAARAHWKLRTENGNKPMDGIIGARCSGASISLARISGLEGVPQLSPASNSPQLSNDEEFPFFSRLVAPNDERGEVGALIAMLRSFGWQRITVLSTDTVFAKDWVTSFRKSWVGDHGDWVGEVYNGGTIRLHPNGDIDAESIQQTLDGIPTDDPTVNSRVVLLAAHSQHAYEILAQAARQNFQKDTIWVGQSSWVPRYVDQDSSWLKDTDIPGYLGVAPYRNRDENYGAFLEELQDWQRARGKAVTTEMPAFARETVDAIRSLATAIAWSRNKSDGAAVVRDLRNLQFDGVSGRVSFSGIGDRKNPEYSIFNAQGVSGDGEIEWKEIGKTGIDIGSVELTDGDTCFAEAGCGREIPPDTYPEPPIPIPVWMLALIIIISLLFAGLALRYWRSKKSKHSMKGELKALRDSVAGMRVAECNYIPLVISPMKTGDVEQALDQSSKVNVRTVNWMWQETKSCMHQHDASTVYGDPEDCWILYDDDTSKNIEKAFNKGKAKFSPLPGYEVKFATMEQTKLKTGFQRKVQRVLKDDSPNVDMTNVEVGDSIPLDLDGEPRIVLVEGDVVQVSKQRSHDDWAFGTKLHHADEATARNLAVTACKDDDAEERNVSTDSGWFQMAKTRIPTGDDLKVLEKNIGDTGTLAQPDSWIPVQDPSVVEKHVLPPGTELSNVVTAFMATLDTNRTTVVKVERIQNLAMWQSYVVKQQTMCNRERRAVTNASITDAFQTKVLDRFERKWLFHGTNYEVMDKILQQGFNRSFCGKNATMYGKGVYYARDASYSSCTTYAVPDRNGFQYVMACRVMVGEFCGGRKDALTPDVRDVKTQALYDCTVDNTRNPSVFVTYHDAQAYPEYLITFKQT